MKRNLEVLSPAGDLAILKAAVTAGADAVYFGGESFGARAYASNFSFEDAQAGITFAHARGARTYLTVNTLLKSLEIEKQVYEYLKKYYEAGIDAVLVQDIGLMQMIREYFPELRLHISTQANVTSEYGAEFFKKLGASRIVLARELSLDEIRQIHDSCDIELECFAHGALCMSYSGQCLMSSLIGGRSGNRGRCAQPCRKRYRLSDSDRKPLCTGGDYPLSLKDLCTIDDVKALYDAGCCSLKIEGRMKSADYVVPVVRAYRIAADLAITGRTSDALSEQKRILADAGTRGGGTDRYLYSHNDTDMVSVTDSSFHTSGAAYAHQSEHKVSAQAVFTAHTGEHIAISISGKDKSTVTITGPIADKARNPRDITDEIRDKIIHTGDDRIDITDVTTDISEDAFVPVSVVKDLRRRAVYEYLGGINVARRAPLAFTPPAAHSRSVNTQAVLITCVSREQLMECTSFTIDDFSVIIAINYELYMHLDDSDITRLKDDNRSVYLCLPEILRSDRGFTMDDARIMRLFDGVIVSSYDEIYYAKKHLPDLPFITDSRLYAFSDRSREALLSFNASSITAPVELNEKELSHLDNSASFISVYGRTPVMYTAVCQHKNTRVCDRQQEILFLRDERKADFPVINYCACCTNVVYNSLPTSLLPYCGKIQHMGFKGLRLDLTTENRAETDEVLTVFRNNITENRTDDVIEDVTRGHFHRGVL